MNPPAASSPVRPSRGRRTPKATGEDRERAIMETLERLLEDRPLHEISVDDLARGAGISRPTFYFYFASKEAVLLSLFDRMLEEARARRPEPDELAHGDPAALWRQTIAAFYETLRGHRAVTLAGADARATSAELRDMWSRVMERWVEEAAAVIEAERARGSAPDGPPARELATTLLWMNERVLHTSFARHAPCVDEADVVDVLLAVWLRAIYARPI